MAILAGDIGGTKTLLQLSRPTINSGFEVLHEKRYASADYRTFEPLIRDFVEDAYQQTGIRAVAACLGIAGPINGRKVNTTNLPWHLDADVLELALGIPKLRLVNDFEAAGCGVEALQQKDIVQLQSGIAVEHGTRIIVGAGTGLGMAFLVWQKDHYEVVASEGGHTTFGPTDAIQIELMQYLKQHYRWATWERLVSGSGLVNIFEFLTQAKGKQISEKLKLALGQEDQAAVIGEFAMRKQDDVAIEALDLFVRLYGSQAGNLALLGLARGGVYIAGGIAAKILDKLQDGTFMQCFLDKEEHMQPLLKAMPVNVVTNEALGLLGAALIASRL